MSNEVTKEWEAGFGVGIILAIILTLLVVGLISAVANDGLSWYSQKENIIEYKCEYYKLVPMKREFNEKGPSDNESKARGTEGSTKAAPVAKGQGSAGSRDHHDDD